MSLTDYVDIQITQDSLGVARAGFGVPLILSHNATFAERVRFYTSLSAVADDGFATTSPEYLAAQAMFAQSPRPKKIAIGRAALKPTQKYLVEVATVRGSHKYQIKVQGEGVTETTVEFTSDADATNDEIVAGLVAQLNLVTGKNFTAAAVGSVGTQDIEVTGDAPGNWFSLEVVSVDDLKIAQTHADPGVATDLAAIALESDEWYALCTLYNSNAYVLAAAAWVESNGRIYVFDVNETDAITTAVGSGDTIDDIKTNAYKRTMGAYHPSPAEMMAAAWMGRVLPRDPGSTSWFGKTLTGVDPVKLTATHKTNLRNKLGNSYMTVAGVNVTFEGTTGAGTATIYGYMDLVRGLDWIKDDMSKGIWGVIAGSEKVPYEDSGVALIEKEVIATLRRGVQRSIVAQDPAFVVEVPRVADVSSADKGARKLPDVKFSFTLAGAIHKVDPVNGVVSL